MGKPTIGMRDRLVATVCLAVLATCAITILGQFWRERAHVDEVFAAQTRLLGEQLRPAIEKGDASTLRSLFQTLANDGGPGNEYATPLSIAAYDGRGKPLPARGGAASADAGLGEIMTSLAQMPSAQNALRIQQDENIITVAVPVGPRRGFAPAGTLVVAWDATAALATIRENASSHAAAATVASLLVMLVVMIMLDRGVVGPLKRLQTHAAGIAASGEPRPIDDPKLLERKDEVGELATVFNSMIDEIARGSRQIAKQNAEMQLRHMQFDMALANMSQGLCMYDAEGRLALCNDRFAKIHGLSRELFPVGLEHRQVLEILLAHGCLADPNIDDVLDEHRAALETNAPATFTRYLSDDRVVSITQTPMPNGGWLSTCEDITERLSAETQITRLAHHDALTELPNRLLFRQELVRTLSRVERGETIAVLCLDLDHFKSVNDTLGHPVGDKHLCAVADRLRTCVREHDIVARLGGDEFAVVQTDLQSMDDPSTLAQRIIEELSTPFEIGGHLVVVGASVGIAFAPHDGNDPDHLLKCADMALFRAKVDGRGTHRLFEPEMDARMQARRLLELDLRAALPRNEFLVYFQPLIDLGSGKVGGFEALLRWRHPKRGMVPPTDFIPLAEEIGLIHDIGMWVIREACGRAAQWPEPIKVAVNLSPLQFKSKTLVADIVEALRVSGLRPQRLELEITESVILTDTEQTLSTLYQLREIGVSVAMDDFGTGYSSLSYLQRFPFDRIKIDRSFVQDLQTRPNSIALIKAITDLGLSLGIATTAEGVETPEQLEDLRNSGCSVAQGFLFSKAIPPDEVAALIRSIDHPGEEDARDAA